MNRTLVWVTLSAVVAGAYALVIAGVGGAAPRRPGASPGCRGWRRRWSRSSFAPLRDALQRGVNRLTFGRWDEPYDVLADLGQRLEASADVDRLLADVIAELAASACATSPSATRAAR